LSPRTWDGRHGIIVGVISVPPRFAAELVAEAGEPARQWLAGLPVLAERLLATWDLTVDGAPMHGAASLVVPVRAAGGPAVLKLPWPHEEATHEALALSIWDGAGAVRLLAHDPPSWALLLERLDASRSLTDAPLDEAVAVLAGLIRRLDRPAPPGMRTQRDVAARWAREIPAENRAAGSPVPGRLVDRAVRYCAELAAAAGNRLVNEDLHYANVLRGTREPWLAIDPKPIAGDHEFGLIPLLWNRFSAADIVPRLDTVVRLAGLDPDLARRWTFLRAVDTWLEGGGFPSPQCARIAVALGNR
jgi:streptomycin 6-kinase